MIATLPRSRSPARSWDEPTQAIRPCWRVTHAVLDRRTLHREDVARLEGERVASHRVSPVARALRPRRDPFAASSFTANMLTLGDRSDAIRSDSGLELWSLANGR